MRLIGGVALAGVIAVVVVGVTNAQELPNCSVKIVVSGPPGGTPDLIARLGAEKISAGIGRPVVVENRAGGLAAITSIEAVKASEPNGCTLFAANASLFSIMPTLYKKPPFEVANDFIPVSVVPVSQRAGHQCQVSGNELEGKSAAQGQSRQISPRLRRDRYADASIRRIAQGSVRPGLYPRPVSRSAAAILGLLADQVQFVFEQIPSFLSHARVGTLRAIAVASDTRSALLPDVPTLTELESERRCGLMVRSCGAARNTQRDH